MRGTRKPIAAALALALPSLWQGAVAQDSSSTSVSDKIVVRSSRVEASDVLNSFRAEAAGLAPYRAVSSDSAAVLDRAFGIGVYGAGGVSSLPVIHGLADDRIRTKVDGMDLISACSNHMNPPLSYTSPTRLGSVEVYAGVTPVRVGGDSIGGTIVVNSPAPGFAKAGQGTLLTGEAGTYYRSNGQAWGANLSATVANENLSLTYAGSTAQSENYKAANDFKAPGTAAWGRERLGGNEVGSSRYKTENQSLGIALRYEEHLLDLQIGRQHIPYQGFPNQHMDMTDNQSTQFNLRYGGQFAWGSLEARVYHEKTRHQMDFADDKLYWYGATHNIAGMPMDTQGKNAGVSVKADIVLSPHDVLRIGGEAQRYRLNDWWSPVAFSMMMGPSTFWNIHNGQRDRNAAFAEWEARWTPQWTSEIGVRYDQVTMNTGNVQAYDSRNPIPMGMGMGMGMGMANPDADAARAFNARNRQRTDDNIDLTAVVRYTPNQTSRFEAGYSRKMRSPSLYERYTWGSGGMAMTMNNWVNDGNGYVGNLDLKPEEAHTLSFTADFHDAARNTWGLRVTPYYTYVHDYIDARCLAAPCKTNEFVYLTLVNQNARLYGIDLSGYFPIAADTGFGRFTGRAALNYVDGKNKTTGDNLYNIMPLNARLAVEQRVGNWTNTVEGQWVAAKHQVSAVRNEIKTPGYGLLHLRSSYDWKQVRFDLGVENALNKLYYLPLGGAYIGQGETMALNGSGAPYGIAVPGMGRSLYAGVTLRF